MNSLTLSAALMSVGLLLAAPAFAQSSGAQKQPTQEGGNTYDACARPYNSNPVADPSCKDYKQHTQNLSPALAQGPDAAKSK